MNNVSIQISQSFWEIEDAREDLDSIYDYFSNSPTGTEEDLRGLNVAIEILSKISFQLRSANDGL